MRSVDLWPTGGSTERDHNNHVKTGQLVSQDRRWHNMDHTFYSDAQPCGIIWINLSLPLTFCLAVRDVTRCRKLDWALCHTESEGYSEQKMNQEGQRSGCNYTMSTGVWIQREIKTTSAFSPHDANQEQQLLGSYQKNVGHDAQWGRKWSQVPLKWPLQGVCRHGNRPTLMVMVPRLSKMKWLPLRCS